MVSSAKVNSYQRKNGSFVKSHWRKVMSRFTGKKEISNSVSPLREATVELVESTQTKPKNLKIHTDGFWTDSFFDQDLTGHTWVNSSLVGSRFDTCNLSRSVFKRTDMNADFTMCKLDNVKLEDVWLGGTTFVNCSIQQVDFTKLESFEDAVFYDCDMSHTNLSGLEVFIGRTIVNCNLQNANLSGVDLSLADISGNNMVGVNWKGTNTQGMVVSQSDKYSHISPRPHISSSSENTPKWPKYKIFYTQHSFVEAAQLMGLSEGQFEFLANSGVVEIRDSEGVIVKSKFDPEKHHVPAWFVQNFHQ